MSEQIEVLKAKNRVFDSLCAQGKVLPRNKDIIFKTFATAEAMSTFYSIAPLVAKPENLFADGKGYGDVLSPAELEVVASGLYSAEELIAGRDLTARDRRIQTERHNKTK